MKKLKPVILFVTYFVIVYILLSIVLAPFIGFNFGAKPTVLEQVIGFFLKFPFGFIGKSYFLLLLVLNGVFWGSVVYLIKTIIQKVI